MRTGKATPQSLGITGVLYLPGYHAHGCGGRLIVSIRCVLKFLFIGLREGTCLRPSSGFLCEECVPSD
jgi:hypothetical protein